MVDRRFGIGGAGSWGFVAELSWSSSVEAETATEGLRMQHSQLDGWQKDENCWGESEGELRSCRRPAEEERAC